ncbi:MAG: hypothetical protein Kow00122_16460 [Thermoleophilia bacterium]
MPRPNKRMLRLFVPLVVLLLIVVLAERLACSGEGGATTGGAGGPVMVGSSGVVEVALGEEAAFGSVRLVVTALAAVEKPVLPVAPAGSGTALPGPGRNLYQALAVLRNGGAVPVRFDPNDFTLRVGDLRLPLDPGRSGPAASTLLPGTSLDLILTFVGPAGREPELEYAPRWSAARVVVKGQRKPAGMVWRGAGSAGGAWPGAGAWSGVGARAGVLGAGV